MNDRFIDLSPHLISGMIDNSVRGKTYGELLINGLEKPLLLELNGNTMSDLAGCVVTFRTKRSFPLDLSEIDFLPHEQKGAVGSISASVKGETMIGSRMVMANLLGIQWYNFSNLMEFIIEISEFELSINLPSWTLSKSEINLQKDALEATRQLFDELCSEFEEELLEDDMLDMLDEILPALDAANSDEERFQIAKQALDPELDDSEIWDILDAYFGPEEEDLFYEDPLMFTITLDADLKQAGNQLLKSCEMLQALAEKEGAPEVAVDFGRFMVVTLIHMLHTSTLLDPNPDAPQIEPELYIEQFSEALGTLESIVRHLESKKEAGLVGRGAITDQEKWVCDHLLAILGETRKLIDMINQKMSETDFE